MGIPIILVAVAAAIGVGLVVYGVVSSRQAVGPEQRVRASYRTLADVREQLRRRFDSTGTPAWIASEQRISTLQQDLVSADLELRPYEFRMIQAAAAVLLGIVGLVRFGVGLEFLLFGGIGYLGPWISPRTRRGHRQREVDAWLPRATRLMANSL